jgi:hypothetical protein
MHAQTQTTMPAPARKLQTREGLDLETLELLSSIDEKVTTGYTLADAIREGSTVTGQAYSWGQGETACALSAAYLAARARGWTS